MVYNAEELKISLEGFNGSDGPAFKTRRIPRITSIGKLLRKTGLDEISRVF